MRTSRGETTKSGVEETPMKGSKISRRDVLAGSSALAVGAAFSTRVMSAAPPASTVTPALIEAAKKEGKVVWYTSVDLKLSEQIGKAFEAKYPGVNCKVERTGAERILQRIGQEYTANVHAVDVRSEEHTSELQSLRHLVCRLLLEK